MKTPLITFSLDKTIVSESPVEKQIDGKPVKVLEKVETKTPITVTLNRPTAKQSRELDVFMAVRISSYEKKGLMTGAQIARYYEEHGGLFSEADQALLAKLSEQQAKLLEEYRGLDKQADNKARMEEMTQVLAEINRKAAFVEETYSSIFAFSAEKLARKDVESWILINLLECAELQFPEGKNFEKSLDYLFDVFDGEDSFKKQILAKASFYIQVWLDKGDVFSVPANVELLEKVWTEREVLENAA